MREFMTIAKALADPNRVRVLLALQGRELCVCQIIELLRLAPSTVSKHMWILRQAQLVESRKDGKWAYYRLADDRAPAEVRAAIAWACGSVAASSEIREDKRRLKSILKVSREELCRSDGKK
jgi:DNA-binding transcriptional ArsR family regulator